MLLEFIRFEINYRKRRPATWIYFLLLFVTAILFVTTELKEIVTRSEQIKENAPYIIAFLQGIVSYFFCMITSAVMGVAVLRDFEYNTEALMFSNPIRKFDYLMGRFIGSFLVLLFIFSGFWLGLAIGDFLPNRKAENLLPFNLLHFIQPFFILVIPNLLFTGALFFAAGALTRKSVMIYTQGIILFVVYNIAQQLLFKIDNRELASYIDPFGITSLNTTIRYWSPAERNMWMIPFSGILLYNRLVVIGLALIILAVTYWGFSFNVVKSSLFKPKKSKKQEEVRIKPENVVIPQVQQLLNTSTYLRQFWSLTTFYYRTIFKEVPFLTIIISGFALFVATVGNTQSWFGVGTLPTTANMLGSLGVLEFFYLAIAVTYAGELVWKERIVKFNLIFDSMPIPDFIGIFSKFLSLILVFCTLFVFFIGLSVLAQAIQGYYDFQLSVYFGTMFSSTLISIVEYLLFFFFIQVIVNDKFLGIAISVGFLILTAVISLMGVEHPLLQFGGQSLGQYSDMNIYGHFVTPFSWMSSYWLAFVMIMFIGATILSVRGADELLETRIAASNHRFSKPLLTATILTLTVLIGTGGYIFYNTNFLETYRSSKNEKKLRADFEKTLKKYENAPQPKIVESNLKVELYPSERKMETEGFYYLKNKTNKPIQDIYISFTADVDVKKLTFDRAFAKQKEWKDFQFTIYHLQKALAPQDSVKMDFKLAVGAKSFLSSVTGTHIVYNGTFFNNSSYFPQLGYVEDAELSDKDDREDNGLKPKEDRLPNQNDPHGLSSNLFGDDADLIRFAMTIGTESDQIAIAPGYLQKSWNANNRRYFSYSMDQPMANFYSIVSARYEVKREKWNGINLEIYYHKGHDKNLDRIMNGMKKALGYYSKNFSPFQYKQMRIMEFPRYASFAQSFANTVPFSESMGFVMDIQKDDPDIPFYVTAHELGHQWWGHQVIEANVKGNGMLSESLSEYSALMVLKNHVSTEVMQKFMKYNLDEYLYGRATERKKEQPLYLCENQQYIHYNKGSVCLYALQDYIGEDKVNQALSEYAKDWKYAGPDRPQKRYPTTLDLLSYLKKATPDSLKYLITDLFETITLYENKTDVATAKKLKNNTYEITLKISTEKSRADKSGNQKVIGMNDWIDVGVYGKDSEGNDKLIYLKKHRFNKKEQTLKLIVKEEPLKAGIDPIHKLIDKHIIDNVKKVSME